MIRRYRDDLAFGLALLRRIAVPILYVSLFPLALLGAAYRLAGGFIKARAA